MNSYSGTSETSYSPNYIGSTPYNTNINWSKSISQGWQCPLCGTVYAPFVSACRNHNYHNTCYSTTTSTNTNIKY